VSSPTILNVWVGIRFGATATDKITGLRNSLDEFLPNAFIPEQSPHLSVIPGAVIPVRSYEKLSEATQNIKLDEPRIQATTVDLYPYYDPYVVKLNVENSLHNVRTQLINRIYELGGSLLYPPVDPHITLYKTGDTQASTPRLTFSTYRDLHQEITAFNNSEMSEKMFIKELEFVLEEF